MEQINYNLSSSKKSSAFFKRFKNFPTILFLAGLFIVILLAFFSTQQSDANPSGTSNSGQTNKQITLQKPNVQKKINKSFTFPLRDQDGKEVSNFIYTIESVETRNQIIVQGQQATAIKGKTFLIINIKLTNNFDKAIQVNARDYLRVIVENSSEKSAPDMHSDPVDVQSISTKPTRLGMTINESDKKIILQIGEIAGKKEKIPVSLK
jgi:hypothetical protein